VSEGHSGTPIVVPDERVERHDRRAREESLPWFGLAGAALLHGSVALALFWGLPELPSEPEIVPVQLVFVPPPEPPPAPALPPVPPTPPAESFTYRESGPQERTVAPPPAETLAPEAAAPPPSPAPTTPPEEEPLPAPPPEKPVVPEEETPKPPKAKREAHLEPQKREAETPRAPRLAAPTLQLHVAPGEKLETGDPYLNQLYRLIESHRVYPRVIGAMGLPVEGTATFDVLLDHSGRLLGMRLARSSGAAGIDEAAAAMIRQIFPAPPPPANYPDPLPIVVAIRLFPPS